MGQGLVGVRVGLPRSHKKLHYYSRALMWALFGGTLVLHIDYMNSFNNTKCLVYVRYYSGDIMVNDVDKIPVVVETNEGTKKIMRCRWVSGWLRTP